MPARVARIAEIDRIDVAGIHWRPVRRTLGVSAFGINAYTADAGEQLIEPHDESGGGGAGGHEELYLLVTGRATFTVDGEEIDATPGTLVFVAEPADRREAVATEDGTSAVVVGGAPGAAGPVSAWEHYFSAAPAIAAGRPAEAYEIASAGLAEHPDNVSMHFNLACYASLAGDADRAIEHLRRAVELDPKAREWAAEDSDLDAIRDDPRWPA